MTVILILLCLAIAGRELFNASDKRLPRAQAEIAELRQRLDERDQVLRDLQSRLPASPDGHGHADPVEVVPGTEVTHGTDILALTRQVGDLSKRVEELSKRVVEAGERLTGLDHRQERDRQARHELAGSLDAAEALLDQVHRHLLHRLDQEAEAGLGGESPDTVRGLLRGATATSRDALTRLYDLFAGSRGMRIELQEETCGPPWCVRYFLTGPAPRELERDFISLVSELRVTPHESAAAAGPSGQAGWEEQAGQAGQAGQTGQTGSAALRSLAFGLLGTRDGTAQIGPLLIARTPDALLCGVLPLTDLQGSGVERLLDGPGAAVERLRSLPEGRFCDLTELGQQPPAAGTGGGAAPSQA